MTKVFTSTKTYTEYVYNVPAGATMKDLDIALHWAEKKAKELGVDTSTDDWAELRLSDDALMIVIISKKAEEN